MAERDELIQQAARDLAAWNNLHPYAVRFKMYNVLDDYPDRDPYVVIVEKVAELLGWAPPNEPSPAELGFARMMTRLREIVDRHRSNPDHDPFDPPIVNAKQILDLGDPHGLWSTSFEEQQDAPCPTCTGPTRETVGMVCQTCGTDYGGEGRAIAHAKAEALRAFADSIRTTEILFRRADGSGVKVTDLLRETAQNYLGEVDDEAAEPPADVMEPCTCPYGINGAMAIRIGVSSDCTQHAERP